MFSYSISTDFAEQVNCTTGELRLVNGSTSSDGRVEMCSDNIWGTIATPYWSLQAAEVACKQLGLPWDCMLS